MKVSPAALKLMLLGSSSLALVAGGEVRAVTHYRERMEVAGRTLDAKPLSQADAKPTPTPKPKPGDCGNITHCGRG